MRKESSSGISFFSFQDIITSVTGVMFIVVLMIILSMFERNAATPDPLEEELKKIKSELEKSIVERLQYTPQENERDLERLKEQQQKLTELLAKETQTEDVLKKARQTHEELTEQVKELTESETKTDQQIQTAREEIVKLEDVLKKASARLKLTIEGQESKKPVMIICAGDALIFKDYQGTETGKITLDKALDPPHRLVSALPEFQKYSPADFYFILLVSPEAYDYADLLNATLRQMNYERGMEPLPNAQTEVF